MVGGRGNRSLVHRVQLLVLLILGAVALLSTTTSRGSLLPLVNAVTEEDMKIKITETENETETETDGEAEVCEWDADTGKKSCAPSGKEPEEYYESNGREDAEYRLHDGWLEDGDFQVYYPDEDENWDVWSHGTKTEIYNELECPDYSETVHTAETWKTFNKVYNEVVAQAKDDENLRQEPTVAKQFEKSGFQFPVEIKFDPKVGRGVYAATDIPKGSLLYLSTNNAAFHSGQLFRNFLKALPSTLACDVLIWSFVRWVSLETDFNGKHMVCTDLDEGSFVNSANVDGEYNFALGNDQGVLYMDATEDEQRELWYGCKMKFWASRDIKAGEEIRAAYDDFAEQDGWVWMGLQYL